MSPGARAPVGGRREFLIGGAMAVTALASGALARGASGLMPKLGAELRIPDHVGPWTRSAAEGVLIPQGETPDDRTYDQVVTGFYTSPSAPSVMLLVAYGGAQTGTTQLHRPEVCYPAAGFKVARWPDVSLKVRGVPIQARAMTATAVERTEQILYWSRVGDDFPTSAMEQRWSVLRNTFRGLIPDGALVRMSIIDPDHQAAVPVLRGFASALVEEADPGARRMLVGTA